MSSQLNLFVRAFLAQNLAWIVMDILCSILNFKEQFSQYAPWLKLIRLKVSYKKLMKIYMKRCFALDIQIKLYFQEEI